MMINRKLLSVITIGLVFLSVQGCTSITRKDAVPEGETARAVIPGLEDVRYRTGIDDELLAKEAIASFYREKKYYASKGRRIPSAVFLAVSGGGDDGAFGAGLLNGWTESGKRPEFKLVTGVSTGALIAPFAFLGSEYDGKLKDFYTNTEPKDILKPRSILAAITSDAMADNKPLWKKLEKQVDQSLLDAIAAEYEKGRLLLVATVDLDARQSVLWNLTKIAASKDPKALHLFHSIMIASAAIPAGFPPVMFDVEVDGTAYQEMHVDGGTMSQVFIYPPSLHVKEISRKHGVTRKRTAYVIRNSRLDPRWAEVERQTMPIAGRAVSSLIQTQGIGDIFRIYLETQRDNVDFNLAYIPESFNVPHKEEFDTTYMRALFKTGYDMGLKGNFWYKKPPGF